MKRSSNHYNSIVRTTVVVVDVVPLIVWVWSTAGLTKSARPYRIRSTVYRLHHTYSRIYPVRVVNVNTINCSLSQFSSVNEKKEKECRYRVIDSKLVSLSLLDTEWKRQSTQWKKKVGIDANDTSRVRTAPPTTTKTWHHSSRFRTVGVALPSVFLVRYGGRSPIISISISISISNTDGLGPRFDYCVVAIQVVWRVSVLSSGNRESVSIITLHCFPIVVVIAFPESTIFRQR